MKIKKIIIWMKLFNCIVRDKHHYKEFANISVGKHKNKNGLNKINYSKPFSQCTICKRIKKELSLPKHFRCNSEPVPDFVPDLNN